MQTQSHPSKWKGIALSSCAPLWELGVYMAWERGAFKLLPDALVWVLWIVPILVVVLVALTSKEVKQRLHQFPKMSLALFLVVGAILGWLTWLWAFKAPQIAEKSMFSARLKSAILSDNTQGPLSVFMVQHGSTVSPIIYLLYIQIVNIQDVPTSIETYSIAASRDVNGPWERIYPIRMTGNTFWNLNDLIPKDAKSKPNVSGPPHLLLPAGTYRLNGVPTSDTLKNALAVDPSPTLESTLDNALAPHETVRGWAAFDTKTRVLDGASFFRITIRDTAGAIYSEVMVLPERDPESTEIEMHVAELMAPSKVADLSSLALRNYTSP